MSRRGRRSKRAGDGSAPLFAERDTGHVLQTSPSGYRGERARVHVEPVSNARVAQTEKPALAALALVLVVLSPRRTTECKLQTNPATVYIDYQRPISPITQSARGRDHASSVPELDPQIGATSHPRWERNALEARWATFEGRQGLETGRKRGLGNWQRPHRAEEGTIWLGRGSGDKEGEGQRGRLEHGA